MNTSFSKIASIFSKPILIKNKIGWAASSSFLLQRHFIQAASNGRTFRLTHRYQPIPVLTTLLQGESWREASILVKP